MNCPNGIRQCPNGWTDCELCAHWKNKVCTYVPEEEPEPEPVCELEEDELATDLGVDIPHVRGTWAERFLALPPDEALEQFYSKHPPNLHHKEPLPLDGGIVPGGGSKSRNHKKPEKKTPEYMKFLGM
ncbi:hypothetical protein [Desulfosporosinus youngiae]|uniref:Uncharacterized protein n=1 Tax=Desulfosporosinus youngiae DSM 17734 TaxID=768710 RepID=H5Y265_9FIRM|nr:hypothetical protein [Desulfosporosinus youngiae]EHQ88263.1 hypothetical protein DesyoDRAFT_1093 [Desulfosporosinus youngiae DSM 17734]